RLAGQKVADAPDGTPILVRARQVEEEVGHAGDPFFRQRFGGARADPRQGGQGELRERGGIGGDHDARGSGRFPLPGRASRLRARTRPPRRRLRVLGLELQDLRGRGDRLRAARRLSPSRDASRDLGGDSPRPGDRLGAISPAAAAFIGGAAPLAVGSRFPLVSQGLGAFSPALGDECGQIGREARQRIHGGEDLSQPARLLLRGCPVEAARRLDQLLEPAPRMPTRLRLSGDGLAEKRQAAKVGGPLPSTTTGETERGMELSLEKLGEAHGSSDVSSGSTNAISRISKVRSPPGVRTTTSSPSRRPISERASGLVTESSPCLRSASSSPTMRYLTVLSVSTSS